MSSHRHVSAAAALVLTLGLGFDAPPAAGAPSAGEAAAIVVVESADPGALLAVKAALEAAGARLPHRFPPRLLVGTVPAEAEAHFVPPAGASVSVVPAGEVAVRVDLPPEAAAARLYLEGVAASEAWSSPAFPEHEDLVAPIDLDLEIRALPSTAKAAADCGRPGALSAFLVGSVAVGIVMPESSAASPNTEDWANPDPRPAYAGMDRRDLVVAEIMEGADRLVTQFPGAGLSFAYQVHRDVPIDHEPIALTVGERGTWIGAAMEEIHAAGHSETASVSGWLRGLRDEPGFDTDWAVAAFVGDDLNDADDGYPPTGFPFAYALLGGPYQVMTYDNDGYTIGGMDSVFKHELAHNFTALDEYASAGNSCSNVAGYLRVPNENNDSTPACLTDVSCIMRGGTGSAVCGFTIGQLGMRDTDGNGIPDVRDQPPNSGFDQASPVLLRAAGTRLTGLLQAKAVAAESPHSPVTYTVNRVASGEWRMDGGAWAPLAADDGAFGDRCETFTLDLAGLSEGWHDVEVRATNDLAILEPSPARLRIYVNADCVDDASEEDGSFEAAVPRPAGVHAGLVTCAFDQDWSRFHLSAGASVTARLTHDPAIGTLRLALVSPSGSVTATAAGAPGDVSLAHVTEVGGSWRLRVDGEDETEGAYQIEIAASCVDDVLEPNAVVAEAPLVAPGSRSDLLLCAGDLDRYRVSVQAGETIAADILFDPVAGDLDLELLDPLGASVASSTGTGGTETVAVTPTVAGVYSLRIFGKTPGDTNAYTLTLTPTGCLDDLRENDDSPLAATLLVQGDALTGRACGADEDWFALTIADRRLVRLIATFDGAAANLDLELRDASGAFTVARSTGTGSLEDITRERLRGGDYRLRVRVVGGGETTYTLSYQSVDPVLLFVAKDPADAVVTWTEASQECYLVRRSLSPADFTGAIETLVQDGGEVVPDRLMRHAGAVTDGVTLWSYLVDPANCGASLIGATKTATPSPVVTQGAGALPSVEYRITLPNDGTQDVVGAIFTDDVPRQAFAFTVLEIPPGATNTSQPAPAGAFMAGRVMVTGINVARGTQAVIRFAVQVGRMTNFFPGPMDNQGSGQTTSPVGPGDLFPTDDPATGAFEDDTRVFIGIPDQRGHFLAMWHRPVDLDLRVIDPCGNVISAQDMPSAACGGQTLGLRTPPHSCAVPSTPTRFEAIEWATFGPPPPGTYRVEVAYVDQCRDRGDDEVTVLWLPAFGAPVWRTTTLPRGAGFVPVLDVTLP